MRRRGNSRGNTGGLIAPPSTSGGGLRVTIRAPWDSGCMLVVAGCWVEVVWSVGQYVLLTRLSACSLLSSRVSASVASCHPARYRGSLSARSMPSRVPSKHPLVHARHAVHIECFRHQAPAPAPDPDKVAIKVGPSCQSNHQPVDQKSRLDRFACFQQSMVFLSAP